ncbi:hypothetical protein L2737_10850 [Shewanella electrodiphila]|uniref:Uncharacterized protein n=1 Tax=Shewanella electrodiphila TaxID=934143 RepID=A0ABT0KPP2_9GAMM|nr:hypothetical protein [Shewanella electrodiphila]MCL1045822.1 hypothetical protein [Shewanella electrodiphila]
MTDKVTGSAYLQGLSLQCNEQYITVGFRFGKNTGVPSAPIDVTVRVDSNEAFVVSTKNFSNSHNSSFMLHDDEQTELIGQLKKGDKLIFKGMNKRTGSPSELHSAGLKGFTKAYTKLAIHCGLNN